MLPEWCKVESKVLNIVARLVELVLPADQVHGLGHVARVIRTACDIAKNYDGVDLEVLLLAAYLHDIGRLSDPENHAMRSAEVARLLLKSLNYPEDRIERVAEAILSHSYSLGRSATSIEAKILSDADKLDALGSVGLIRVLAFSRELGRDVKGLVEHVRTKLLRLPDSMLTSEGRVEAERRVRLIREFLEGLLRDLRSAGPS